MDFGHGFVPRLDKRNWPGVDRALGPPGRLPLDEPLDLPWVIVDLAWVVGKPFGRPGLHAHGVKVIADASAWGYREYATFSIAPCRAPPTRRRIGSLTLVPSCGRSSRRCCVPSAERVDAYLVPGFALRSRTDDVAALTVEAIGTAVVMTDLEPRPMVVFVGMHSEQLEAGVRLVEDLDRGVAAVYAQITPFKPQADTVQAASRMKGKGTGRRVYVPQLGLSLPGWTISSSSAPRGSNSPYAAISPAAGSTRWTRRAPEPPNTRCELGSVRPFPMTNCRGAWCSSRSNVLTAVRVDEDVDKGPAPPSACESRTAGSAGVGPSLDRRQRPRRAANWTQPA